MANNNLAPFELEPVYIEFREESQVGYDITIHQNDTMTLNFICRNMGQLEDMTQYNVELRVHNGSSNTDYIQTQTDIIKNTDGTVKIKCSSKLAQFSGNCKGILHIWKDDHTQKSTRLISIRVIADVTETIQGRIAESTITKLDELDWLLKEAYKLESEFEEKIKEAIKSKDELNNKIVEANNTRKTVEDTIVTANTTKDNLEKTDKIANDTNDILNKTIVNADNSKKALDESKTNADNSKKVLDVSTEVANNTNIEINNSNKTALETKKEVDESIKNAIETKKNVDNSNMTALETKSILESTTINADNKKKEVDKSIESAITNKANLDKSNEEAKNTDGQLNITNASSTKTKEDLHNENVLADGKIEVMKKIDPNNVLTDVTDLKKEITGARGTYTDLGTRIDNIQARDGVTVYVEKNKPNRDGVWFDTSDIVETVEENSVAKEIRNYIDTGIKVDVEKNNKDLEELNKLKPEFVSTYSDKFSTNKEVTNIKTDTLKQVKIGVEGKTVINLLGNDGDCEDINKWNADGTSVAIDSTNKVFGTNSIKLISTGTYGLMRKDVLTAIDTSKYYCMNGYVKNGNATNIKLSFWTSITEVFSQVVTSTTNFSRVFTKIKPSDISGATFAKVNAITNGTTGQYAYVDGIMLEEITKTQYDDANFEPSPYVSGDMSVGEVPTKIKTVGKNLINLVQGSYRGDLSGKFINMPTRVTHKDGVINVNPNTRYIISLDKPLSCTYNEFDESRQVLSNFDWTFPTTKLTFTTGINTKYIGTAFKIDDTTPIYPSDYQIQLEEGIEATEYESYKETCLNIDQPLRSLPSGVKNEIKDGKLIKRVEKVILDGSLTWHYELVVKDVGFKGVWAILPTQNFIPGKGMVLKYNNKKLELYDFYTNTTVDGVSFYAQEHGMCVYLKIPNSDSGWGDNYTPTFDEVKAYFYGWKMWGDNWSLYTTGVKHWTYLENKAGDTTGMINSIAPTATTQNYTPYRLYYQLVTPKITELNQPNLITYPNGSLIVESDKQSWVRPTINYQVADSLKANLDEVMIGLNESKRSLINTFMYRGAIPEDENLDNITQPGTYVVYDCKNMTHTPPNGSYSILEVIWTPTGYLKQTLSAVITGIIYVRCRTEWFWTEWKQIVTTESLALTLLNGWINYSLPNDSNGFGTATAYLIGNMVHLKGVIRDGVSTNGTILTALPQNLRPKASYIQYLHIGDKSYRVDINSSGNITLGSDYPGSSYISLDSISFPLY